MKNLYQVLTLTLTTLFGILILTATATAQERGNDEPRTSPNAAVGQTIGTTDVYLTYGRPSINNRTIFGGLVPFDAVWRTGANEATAITFSGNVTVGGNEIEQGTYSLHTIPGEDEWTIIINSNISWGTQYDESQDVTRFTVQPEEGKKVEQFRIYFENVTDNSGECVLHWDTTKVPFTIEV